MVGLYYIKKSDPTVGSVLYMIFYAIHIGLLYLMLWIYPIIWLVVLIGVIYAGLLIGAIVLLNSAD